MAETNFHKSEENWVKLDHPVFSIERKISQITKKFTNNGNPNSFREEDLLEAVCKKCGQKSTINPRSLYRNGSTGCRKCPKAKSRGERQLKIGQIINDLKVLRVELQPYGKGYRNFWIFECQNCNKVFRKRLGSESKYVSGFHACSDCNKKSGNRFKSPFIKKNISRVFKSLRTGAIKRGLAFDIIIRDMTDCFEKQNGLCVLTGVPICIEDGTASLDRIDSNLGYSTENIQWLYKPINFMKSSFEESEFVRLCKLVASHR